MEEKQGLSICPKCVKIYSGNGTNEECFECYLKENSISDTTSGLGATGNWDYYKIPNTIQALSRDAVVSYLTNCPKKRAIYFDVLHNSATPPQNGIEVVKSFQSYHISKGWLDNGYHFVITPDGIIYQCRNLIYQGAHAAGGGNEGSMGYCLVGNFSGNGGLPTAAQIDSARFLATTCARIFGYSKHTGHRFCVQPANRTSCPGTNITLDMIQKWMVSLPTPPIIKKKEEELMLVPFEKVSKQGDLFVWVASEGWYELNAWSGECWLIIKNESNSQAKVYIYTTPPSGEHVITIPKRDDKKSRIAINMKDIGAPAGGFATTVKSSSADIVPQLSILATKK